MKRGKQFGLWLFETEANELSKKIDASGKNTSQYLKEQLDLVPKLHEALTELFEYMGSDMMAFTKKPSPTDLRFFEKIRELVNHGLV